MAEIACSYVGVFSQYIKMPTKIIKIYNEYHLGDQIFNFIFFYNIKDYIEKNDIVINYYCKKEYHSQLSEFKCSENINILDYDSGQDNGFQLWVGNSNDFRLHAYNYKQSEYNKYDTFYVSFFNHFSKLYNLPEIEKLEYRDSDLLERYDRISNKDKYLNVDFLILNSTPKSNQYVKDDVKWNKLIYKLAEKYKVVTSEKVEGIPCTCDDHLTIKDIAAISTHATKIIAINSGVVPGLFNQYTLDNVDSIYCFDDLNPYNHSKFIHTKDIEDLYFLVDSKKESFQSAQFDYSFYFLFFIIMGVGMYFFIMFIPLKIINRLRWFRLQMQRCCT